jgi:predicted dehydrogenase
MAESRPIRTALLSYGMSGEIFHGPLLAAHRGFELATIVQRHSDRALTHYPNVRLARHTDDVMADSSIELVVVNTPNETHAALVTQALQAGKHVVVEKPFTVTANEANALIVLADQKDLVLTVFQNRRWDGDFRTVQKVIEQKLTGTVVEFEAHYDRFRNYIEANTWKEESRPGTGILYNLGSHMLDQVLMLFGMPKTVDARMGIQRPGGKVDDFYDIRLEYRGFHCIVKSSYLVREPGPRYVIHGTEGSFVKYGLDPQEQALKERKVPGSAGWGLELPEFWGKLNTTIGDLHYEGKIETLPGDYLQFYDSVYGAIREGKPLAVTPEHARKVIQLIEACMTSNHNRAPVVFS